MKRHRRWMLGLSLLFCVGLAILPSCLVASSEGSQVHLSLRGLMGPATSADGVSVTLDELFLHVESAEIVACEDGTEALLDFSLGPSVARAHHGTAEGTVLRTPHLVGLHEPALELGTFRPPPGRYCEVHLTVSPAVSETTGVPEAMLGLSLWGHGSVGGPPRDVYGFGIVHWELPLGTPLLLEGERLEADLMVELDLAATITDVNADDAELFGGEVLHALSSHAAVRETPAE